MNILEDIPIWEIMIAEGNSESQIQQTIYSGYVAMDQIIRDTRAPESIYSARGSMEVIGSIRKLVWAHRLRPRDTWRDIAHDKRWCTETALSVAEDLEKSRQNGNIPWLNKKNVVLQEDLLDGTCEKLKYSRWDLREGWLDMTENHISSSNILSISEIRRIIKDKMLCKKKTQYYSRKGGLEKDVETAIENAKNSLWNWFSDNQVRVEDGQPSLVSALVAAKHFNLHQRSVDGRNEEFLDELRADLGNDNLSWDMIRRLTSTESEEWED
jgi:hypothetical protein